MALYRCIAQGGAAATDITPSNSTPASMSADGVYHATAAGYAIESYNSVTPSNSTPVALTSGDIDKMGGNGYAIASYNNVTPSNSSPVALTSGDIDKMGGAGYAIESYSEKTPPISAFQKLSNGGIYKISGNDGYITENYNIVTPGNNVGTSLFNNEICKINGSGYAIASYESVTPSAEGAAFSAGFVKMSSAGYAYSSLVEITDYTNPASSISSTSTSFSLSSMNGKKLLVFLFYQAGSATAYNRLDGATASGGTISKLCNLRTTNGQAYGTFYNLSVTSNTCTITAPYACFMQVFGTE